MAERPCATAPLRSMLAFSTRTIFRSRPQYRDSYAAPHPPKPPPMMRMSESTKRVLLPMASRLCLECGKCVDVERRGFVRQHLRADSAQVRPLVIRRRLYRTPRRGPDRECEFLKSAVAIPDLPGDHAFFRFPEHPHLVAQRSEVRIASYVDRILRACLHAAVALPAEI